MKWHAEEKRFPKNRWQLVAKTVKTVTVTVNRLPS